jgi:mannose-1-phosphate guanylyltransferase
VTCCHRLPLLLPGLTLHLDSLNIHNPSALYNAPGVSGNVLVAASAKIGADCKIGPDVSIGEGCVIGDGVRLSNCVVMKGVEVGKHTKVSSCC